MVLLSHTGQKPHFDDLRKLKLEGVRYVNEDGILIDKVQAGKETQSTDSSNFGPESKGVPMDDCHSTRAVDIFPMNFFVDPSILFSGPSRTSFF